MEIFAITLIVIGLVVMLIPVFSSEPAGSEPAYGEISNFNLYFRACFQPEKIFRFILRDKDDILEYTHYMVTCFGLAFGFAGLFLLAPFVGDIAGGNPIGTVFLYLLIICTPVAFFYGCAFLLYHIGKNFGGLAYGKGIRLTLVVSLFPVLVAWIIFIQLMYLLSTGDISTASSTGVFVLAIAGVIILALMIWHWAILLKGVRLFHSISSTQAVATVGLIALIIFSGGFFFFTLILC